MILPQKCCDFGEFKCDVSMPVMGRVVCVDYCISDIIAALNAANIKTLASCCGHSKKNGIISLLDGREITIKYVKGKINNA